jgi:hypothetical protein
VQLVAGSSPSAGRDACSVAGGETWPSLDVFTLLLQPTGGQSYGPHALGNAQVTIGTDA